MDCDVTLFRRTFMNHHHQQDLFLYNEGIVFHDTSDSIQGLGGPMTRARTKKVKEALTQLMAKVLEFKPTLESMEDKMVMCIKPLEDGWGAYLAAHFI
ncbi:hypothetical protein MtrunA17_Chr7g0239031 [Medicago truncatula]|uniref:Uncharacterized protein n=1 Tax=Medicago truncatula TaxID=3880 RepID=A0A396H363_MEDTR|nr:hypothetical protein MtrunA17_Chr7g0239031 [Medicago truncatula]